jgi:hypothetical protein
MSSFLQRLSKPPPETRGKRDERVYGSDAIHGGFAGAEVLASRLLADLRMRRVPEGQTREYRAALAQAEAALDTYLGLFYPPDAR